MRRRGGGEGARRKEKQNRWKRTGEKRKRRGERGNSKVEEKEEGKKEIARGIGEEDDNGRREGKRR